MTYILSALAARDLDGIWEFIAQDSPRNAEKYMARIRGQLSQLARNPPTGRPRPELGAGIRSFPIGSHVVLYVVTDGAIVVARVLHGAMNIDEDVVKDWY